jgi:hypothetical protein
MAKSAKPNWSQNNAVTLPPRIVYTRKNTPLAEWKVMLKEEMIKLDLDFNDHPSLSMLHAWEHDDTPRNYAMSVKQMIARRANREYLNKHNP